MEHKARAAPDAQFAIAGGSRDADARSVGGLAWSRPGEPESQPVPARPRPPRDMRGAGAPGRRLPWCSEGPTCVFLAEISGGTASRAYSHCESSATFCVHGAKMRIQTRGHVTNANLNYNNESNYSDKQAYEHPHKNLSDPKSWIFARNRACTKFKKPLHDLMPEIRPLKS